MTRFPQTFWMLATLLIAPAVAIGDAVKYPEEPIKERDRDHWAYQPLRDAAPPRVQDAAWARNAIDRFVLARLEAKGLRPSPEADRVTLIRRVMFDLVGLPPTPEQIDAFVRDKRDDAYEALVERLLASDAYGERWAQHWLDLARFAETDGFEHDKLRPDAWRYRDWVIDALNADMPYDRFVRSQIAGDELLGHDAVATGFLVAGPDMPDINDQNERRHVVLNEITSTVGAVFLGLTMECAQCHQHKYDPISQHDFYRLRSFFDSALAKMNRSKQLPFRLAETSTSGPPGRLMVRGDFRRPGPELAPAYPRIADTWGCDIEALDDIAPIERDGIRSTGRRAALANWLTTDDNALALRVIVNRVWMHHFTRPLVATPSDFGSMGAAPTHPALLDWLAAELPRRGWSLKAMHRLMVTSATYRQSSRPMGVDDARWRAGAAADPHNALLWRMNRRRLSGEAMRDAMLAASGSLETARRGGPGVRPPLPKEVTGTLLKNQWTVTKDERDHRRRSVYLFVRRNLPFPMFDVFDRPGANAPCARRGASTIAPQALTLLNAALSQEAAQRLADHVVAQVPEDVDAQIELAYRATLGRVPTSDERRAAATLVRDAPLSDLCLALFNFNEFIYVD